MECIVIAGAMATAILGLAGYHAKTVKAKDEEIKRLNEERMLLVRERLVFSNVLMEANRAEKPFSPPFSSGQQDDPGRSGSPGRAA